MIKSNRHGIKNLIDAAARDCAPGHSPHNPRICYHPKHGFRIDSKLSPMADGYVYACDYEPYGITPADYRDACCGIEENKQCTKK